MPLNVNSSVTNTHDGLETSTTDTTELESTTSSAVNRPEMEASHFLVEEIKYINRQLIDTALAAVKDDNDFIGAHGRGRIVKCTYHARSVTPTLKAMLESTGSSIMSVPFLVPANYPYSLSGSTRYKLNQALNSEIFSQRQDSSSS